MPGLTAVLTTEHLRGPVAFDALSAEWDALAVRGCTDTPFQTVAYQRAWWTHLGEGELHTIAVRADDHRLIGIACLNLRAGVLLFNASKEETDYLDLIAAPEDAPAVWEAVLTALCQPDFPEWTALDFWNVPADSPTRTVLPALAAARGLFCAETTAEVCPIIELPATFDAYLEQLDGKQRHELRRKLRLAQANDAVAVRIVDPVALPQAVDDFLALLQRSTPEKAAWLNPGRTELFHEAARAALAQGTLDLLFLEVDGVRAAALFNFAYRDRIWVYNSGLDPLRFGRLSVGAILSALSIEQAIAAGYRRYDLLRGNEVYKYRLGGHDHPIYRLQLTR